MKKLFPTIFALSVLTFISNPSTIVSNNSDRGNMNNQDEPVITEDEEDENDDLVEEDNEDPETELATNSAGKLGANRSVTAREHMSTVAEQVEKLLAIPNRQGGIGEQVRLIAQEQEHTQEQLQTQLGQLENRSRITRSLIGPNFRIMNNIQAHLDNNQTRIDQLTALQKTALYPAEGEEVNQAVEALERQNELLLQRLQEEQSSFSVFGWFFRLFN